MPSPPLSPTPRRWQSPDSGSTPEFAALLSSFDATTSSDRQEYFNTRQSPTHSDDEADEVEGFLSTHQPLGPGIRTTSPSPQRRLDSPNRSEEGRVSPLPSPPDLGRLTGTSAENTAAVSGLTRGLSLKGSVGGPRERSFRELRPKLYYPEADDSSAFSAIYSASRHFSDDPHYSSAANRPINWNHRRGICRCLHPTRRVGIIQHLRPVSQYPSYQPQPHRHRPSSH